MVDDAQRQLRTAVLLGSVEDTRRALDAVDARHVDEYGHSMLNRAILGGHVAVARLLMERGVDIRHPKVTRWDRLLYSNKAAAVRLLLRRGVVERWAMAPVDAHLEATAGSVAALVLHVDGLLRRGVWSLETHHWLPAATRSRAVELGLFGRLKFGKDRSPPDWWYLHVMPFAIERAPDQPSRRPRDPDERDDNDDDRLARSERDDNDGVALEEHTRRLRAMARTLERSGADAAARAAAQGYATGGKS